MLLIWGHNSTEILQKQKQAIRVIHSKHHLCHSEPLFKSAKILKINELYTQSQLKFYRKYINTQLLQYFMSMNFKRNRDNHSYDTIHKNSFISSKPTSESSRNLLRYSIPALLNNLSPVLNEALYSKSDRALPNTFKFITFVVTLALNS